MSSFVPAQFSSFKSNFDFDKLRTDTTSSVTTRLSQLRPPQEFLDPQRFAKPNGVLDLQRRVSYNLSYYASNYMLVAGLISLYLIVTNLPLLFLIVCDAALIYGVQRLFGQADEISFHGINIPKSTIYTILLVINLPVLFLSSPITTLLWLIFSSAAVILTHASFYDQPVEASYSDAV